MSLATDDRPEHTIDARNRIASVNRAWVELVHVNAAEADVIGRPLWDFVEGVQVRQLWEILFERVRAVGAPVFVPMRADTASMRRVWDVELHPLAENAIRLVFEPVWSEKRPAVALLDPAYPRNELSLPFCHWCNRIQVRIGAWEEIEYAQLTLRLEAAETLPSLRKAACTSCKQSLLNTFPARVA